MQILKFYFILFIIILSCATEDNKEKNLDKFFIVCENPETSFVTKKSYALVLHKKIINKNNDSINRLNINRIAKILFNIRELQEFKKTAVILKTRSIKENDSLQLAHSYLFLGDYYQQMSFNDSSFFYYIKSEKIYEKLKNNEGLARVNYLKALTLYYCNDYLGSEISIIKSLKISKKENFFNLLFDNYILIATNSFEQKDYIKSLEYNSIALKIHFENNLMNYFKSKVYMHIGFVYLKMNDYPKALDSFRKALNVNNLITKDPLVYTCIMDNLAHANFKLKNYSQLPQLYFQAARIRDSLQIEQGQNYNRLYLSEYYAAMKDTAKSSYYAHEAFALSKKFKAPTDMLHVLKQLSKIEPQHALKYSNDYIRISDSIYQLERETRNKFAKIAYETEEITNEKNTALTHKSIYSSIALAIFAFGFLIFIIIHQKNKHKEMYFVQQQQKNNEEIYQLIQLQHHKVEEARLVEKQRIAQDLHDGIMNKLASTRFNLHLLTKKNDEDTFSKCAPYIDGIQDIEKEIRNIAHDLNNQVFAKNSSFKNTLTTLFDEQKEIIKAKFHIEFSNEINWEHLKGKIKIHIFRIFQELLQNISKHAAANNVIVSATIKKEVLFLEVYDDGEGFSLKGKKKGIGLQNIYARVKECGGTIKILSNKGQGTKVIIKIPIQKEIKIV